jgi:membrane protein YdbS with pleckstrin-like domain
MEHKTKTNSVFWRSAAIIIHIILNIIIVTRLTDFDLTGSWLIFIGFLLLLLVLIFLFIKHLLSFLYFLKNN